jgi:dienelactone hydrolase
MEKSSKISMFFAFMLLTVCLSAQFQIGTRDVTLYDASRTRDIVCTFHYPATTPGSNAPVAAGTFPLIVFGHGFSMGVDAYVNFADELVPLGYVLCLPKTESGLSPNHETFGLDLRFVNSNVKSRATSDAAFFLYQKLTNRTAIMGHSMGGGAAFLAAANNTELYTLVTFAAAETSVSAVAAAANVNVPALVFIGENDGVTPPVDHQIPMYNNIPAGCKGSVTIKGGGHCFFANYNLACSTGEMFTSPQPSITRAAQHTAMFNALKPYLEWMLKDQHAQRSVFEGIIGQTATYTSLFNCTMVSVEDFSSEISVFPNPVDDFLSVDFQGNVNSFSLLSIDGKLIGNVNYSQDNSMLKIDMSHLSSGMYILNINTDNASHNIKVMKK